MKTAKQTEYLDHVVMFNGTDLVKLDDASIIDEVFNTKQELVDALRGQSIQVDDTKRISIEDGEMTQYHYFA